jgi:cyclic pyranopterin phosphate synthase
MTERMHFAPTAQTLNFEETITIVSAFAALGVNKVRITGGEPLVRGDIVSLVSEIAGIDGLKHIALSTNGILLEQYASRLREAGLGSVNISLDTPNADKFRRMTRVGNLDETLKGIDAAIRAGFERVKINSVLLDGYNDQDILSLVSLARRKGVDISFIEEMPLGMITEHRRARTQYSSKKAHELIMSRYPLKPSSLDTGGPSRYYTMPDSSTHVGFISPHSNNFCLSCNRVRLTATGQLLLCLGNEQAVDLRAIVRAPDFDASHPKPLLNAIRMAMDIKPLGHTFDYHRPDKQVLRLMSVTGG